MKAEEVSEKMVDTWEEFSSIYADEYHQINVLMDGKDFDRPAVIKEMHRLFSMDGEDPKFGKRGSNVVVDVASMKRRVKHAIYCRKMECVVEAMWFVTLLTRMRDHCKRTNHPMPASCFKFLSALYMMIQYGFEVTHNLFYEILERTIRDEDHKGIVVHRALRAVREHIRIDAEHFLEYLNSRGIQPCSELLAQVRLLRQQRTRAERAANIKFAIDHDAVDHSTAIPRAPPGSVPRDVSNRPHRINFCPVPRSAGAADEGVDTFLSLPVNKSLNLIKEDSELNDYGETVNSLKTPRKPQTPLSKKPGATAADIHPPTPSVRHVPGYDRRGSGGVLWEDDGDEDQEEDDVVVELRLPTGISHKQHKIN